MARFAAPPATAPPKVEKKEEPIVSTGQVLSGLAVAALIVLASRGRIDPGRAERWSRNLIKGIVGLGGVHQITKIPQHGPGPEIEVPPNPAKPPTLAELLDQLSRLPSPSNVYIKFRDQKTGNVIEIPIEGLQTLIEHGFITKAQADRAIERIKINQTKQWLADP